MEFNNGNIAALQGELSGERLGMHVFPAAYSRHLAVQSLVSMGEFNDAAILVDEGLRISEAVVHPLSQLYMYMAAGFLYSYRGHFSEAFRLLEQARLLCEVTGARLISAWVNSYLGFASAHSGRIAEGISYLEESLDTLTTLRVMLRRSLVFAWLGEAYALGGRIDDATTCLKKAVGFAQSQLERSHEAEAHLISGDIVLHYDRHAVEAATSSYSLAMSIATDLEMRPLLARCDLALGELYLGTNDTVHSRNHLSAALDKFRELDMRHWQERAASKIARLPGRDREI